ncbi:SPARC-like [Ruditapes philippinarum]|uniref:SPARC-like n=1 Tax=Ruditapes philippinarum TaxID=129788 RepID=UPI00295BB6C9|nr:SPARC-like [Ruditapes philippinarum]
MKLTWLLVLCLVVTAVVAKDRSKRKNRERNKKVERGRPENPREIEADDDDDEYETIDVIQEGGEKESFQNPCNNHRCKRGATCQLEDKEPKCVCQTCDDKLEEELKLPVCSTKNVTYMSECHLDREHCLCMNGLPGCSDQVDKVRLDYFSACKELTTCPKDELERFPERMRGWLFRVMTDMAMRGYPELDDYRDFLEKARHDENHAGAVIWKFCDLDVHPNDRQVTRRELMYITASIKHMEHCLVPFLKECDANDDNSITLQEWANCLRIPQAALVDQCKHSK